LDILSASGKKSVHTEEFDMLNLRSLIVRSFACALGSACVVSIANAQVGHFSTNVSVMTPESALLQPNLASFQWDLTPTRPPAARSIAVVAPLASYGLGFQLRPAVNSRVAWPQIGESAYNQKLEAAAFFKYTIAPQRLGLQSTLRLGTSALTASSIAMDVKLSTHTLSSGVPEEGWSYSTGASIGRLFNDSRLGVMGPRPVNAGRVYFTADYRF
jgi:hypothetical protein